MADSFANAGNACIVLSLCDAIHENKDRLSEIDGATGDGDHGVNMNKGFTMAKERIDVASSLSDALEVLGDTLVDDIGGSMGPIYGTFFLTFADDLGESEALHDAAEALMELAGAKPGDKTLVDTVLPASEAFSKAGAEGRTFADCLKAMSDGAEKGWKSTAGMQAKLGRAARLGERSIGHLDAGATSCCIILQSMASSITAIL